MQTELATLDATTKEPPKTRIGTASNASSMFFRMRDADQLRSQNRARVQGQIDGNAPFKRSELLAKGMGSACNLNFRQAGAIIDQYRTPYFDLLVEVPMIAEIQTAFGTVTERADWSQIISEEYNRMVTNWSEWDKVMQFSQYQMLVHGIGFLYFPDDKDWRPDSAKTGDVLVPDGSRSSTEEIEVLCIQKSYASNRLYRYIRNPKQATDVGWNVPATENAIIDAFNGSAMPPPGANAYEFYQSKLKNADIYYGTSESRQVQTSHVLVAEFDGRVSHHIIRADRSSEEFLFSDIGRFDSMQSVICPFFYTIGDGTWHSVGGLGKEMFAYCEVFNQLRCKEVDGAMIASTVLLQQTSADSLTKSQLLSLANLSIIPAGLQMMSSTIGQGIDATVSVRRDMEAGLNNNIGLMRDAPGETVPRRGQKHAILELQQQAALGKGNINRYYVSLDMLHRQMFPRAASPNVRAFHPGGPQALEFQRRCVMRGVPLQALSEIDSIKAMRSLGAGSAVNAMMAAQAIMENAGSYPEEGRVLAIRDWISRTAGGSFADRYMGELNTNRSTEDDSIAALENNALRTGGQVVITIQQSHVRHLESHLTDAEAHEAEVMGLDAESGAGVAALQALHVHLDGAGKHCYEHLQQLSQDKIRAGDYQNLYKRWQQLSRAQDQVTQRLEEQMQAEAEQQAQGQAPEAQQDILKLLNYKSAPESVKAQMEAAVGLERAPGDISESGRNLEIKEQTLGIKVATARQKMVLGDVTVAESVKKNDHSMMTSNAKLALEAQKQRQEEAKEKPETPMK